MGKKRKGERSGYEAVHPTAAKSRLFPPTQSHVSPVTLSPQT
ncbi:Uncharacterised protein [Vibrio cholerae]|nr:Uncharacterised protein [Vibrio cholerae]